MAGEEGGDAETFLQGDYTGSKLSFSALPIVDSL
jgi:hypothetical protein